MTMEGGQLAIRGLRGLEGVYLVVEGISGPDEEAGMTEQLLREDAELCLRGMGMAPLGAGEWLTSSGAPHLYVRVDVARGDLADGELAGEPEKGDTAGFAAAVQVREKVSLERARTVYGVAIDRQTMAVDAANTRKLRKAMSKSRPPAGFVSRQ